MTLMIGCDVVTKAGTALGMIWEDAHAFRGSSMILRLLILQGRALHDQVTYQVAHSMVVPFTALGVIPHGGRLSVRSAKEVSIS